MYNDNKNENDDDNLFPIMKLEDTFAYLASYVVWNSKFPHDGRYVSLIHGDWAYCIDGSIFYDFETKYVERTNSPIKQCLPYDVITEESLRFCYYKISLTMLPDNLVLKTKQRERWGFCYYPYANHRDKSFIIFAALPEEVHEEVHEDHSVH
jgi:hypothetical protein